MEDFQPPSPGGPSPRLWGTPVPGHVRQNLHRSIPTPVGNAYSNFNSVCQMAVHPHACGERAPLLPLLAGRGGPSPRLWGTPGSKPSHEWRRRSIPTPVGNALSCPCCLRRQSVHPHACGERPSSPWRSDLQRGPSPRLWGTREVTARFAVLIRSIPTPVGNARRVAIESSEERGPSPRLWGTPGAVGPCPSQRRSIPTPVGNAAPAPWPTTGWPVHPHACGERAHRRRICTRTSGPSPRLWGTRGLAAMTQPSPRSIPTPVGNAQARTGAAWASAVHPHACGERNRMTAGRNRIHGPSPRLWGTPAC